MTAKAKVDWEAIEREYRTGQGSLAEIGLQFGVSKGRISQVASRDGWDRDLSVRIKAKAEAKLNETLLNKELNAKQKQSSDKDRVEAGAKVIVDTTLEHRKDIRRNRSLANKLLAELEAQCDNPDEFSRLAALMASDDESKLNELYRKVISLPSRIDGAKKLAETLRVTIALEREAYGMDKADQSDENPLAALLKSLGGSVIGPKRV